MTDKNQPKGNSPSQVDKQKGQGVQPNPGVGQPSNAKGKINKQGNPAGQGNEGDDVKPAGRDTPG